MKSLHTALSLFFLFATFTCSFAQQVGDNISVSMKKGSYFQGELLEINEEQLIIKTEDFGTITLSQQDIDDIRKLIKGKAKSGKKRKNRKNRKQSDTGENEGEDVYWHKNPSATHYLFGSTGYTLKKNQMEFQSIWAIVNTFKYGVTDHLTLGVGFEILSLTFNNSGSPGFGVTAKYAFPILPNKYNVSVNALYFKAPDEENSHVGIFYGANTLGNRDKNVTAGLGFIVSNGLSDTRPLLHLSGMIRVGQKFGLITENWVMAPIFADKSNFFNDVTFLSMISFGGRHIGKNVVVDFSIIVNRAEDAGLPWISITIPIGK